MFTMIRPIDRTEAGLKICIYNYIIRVLIQEIYGEGVFVQWLDIFDEVQNVGLSVEVNRGVLFSKPKAQPMIHARPTQPSLV